MGDLTLAPVAALAVGSPVAGAIAAWWLHRRTQLSPRNLYLAWSASLPLAAGSALTGSLAAVAAGGALTAACTGFRPQVCEIQR